MDFHSILQKQRNFFATGATLDINFRLAQLRKLKSLIKENESYILDAMHKDLRRDPAETYLIELVVTLEELNYVINKLKSWAKPKRVRTPFPLLTPGVSRLYYEPYGCALIISPWNYPIFLNFSPMIGAMAAGNCVLLKPSEIASASQEVLSDIINNNFPAEYIFSIEASPNEMDSLLAEKFDYIFFTGGTQIGKIIMSAAAKHLTPVTLELGGKSPCIIDASANLTYASTRIIWGKMCNAGQTCIAPDYIFVHSSVKEKFIEECKKVLNAFYGVDPSKSNSFDRIINTKHFERLEKLMQQGRIIVGGQINKNDLYIAPTLIDQVTWQDPIMQEEIFGPLLPIISFDSLDEVIQKLNTESSPLALYMFSNERSAINKVIQRVSFGGGCINDCLLHVANPHLPFGGIGNSGLGSYHGKFSFETFSHKKGVYERKPKIAMGLEYPPYTARKLGWLRRLLRQ